MRLALLASAIVLTLAPSSATAQMATPDPAGSRPTCPTAPAPPPPELAGWSAMAPVRAAASAGELGLATLPIGRGALATLAPTAAIAYPIPPDHPGSAASYGGLFAFTATEAGTYRIGLGTAAWIDVVKDGRALRSTAHSHGPDCSGVRKMVDFSLAPGRYTLQIAGNPGLTLSLIVAKLPA